MAERSAVFDKVLVNYGLTFTYVDVSVAENAGRDDLSGDEAGPVSRRRRI